MRQLSEFYRDDHRRLDRLWRRMLCGGTAEAQRAFVEFRSGLEQHIEWEERLLFPLLEAAEHPDIRRRTDLLCWEHRHLRAWLERVGSHLVRRDEEAALEREAFAGLLAGHNDFEERLVYPLLEPTATPDELREMWMRMGMPAI